VATPLDATVTIDSPTRDHRWAGWVGTDWSDDPERQEDGMAPRYRLLLTAVLMSLLLAAGCGTTSKKIAATAPGGIANCVGHPQARPAVVDIKCDDMGLTARNLRWSGWGTPVATATGLAVVNLCEYVVCHTGSYGAYPVVLIASGMLSCPKGDHAYARLQYTFVGHFDGWPADELTEIVPRPCGHIPPGKDYEPWVPPVVLK
jgi:hypothetical protein